MVEDKSSQLIAFSSLTTNSISIGTIGSDTLYSTFEGPTLKSQTENKDGSATHLAGIPESNQLISLIHGADSATFQIIDVSSKGVKKLVYEFQEVSGAVGRGDIAYNAKKGCAAMIPIQDQTAYHFFDFDSMSVVRSSKWPTELQERITSLSFDGEAKLIATVDMNGNVLVSEVNSDETKFVLPIKKFEHPSETNRVRWSPITGDSTVFVKYDFWKLNLLDVEKKALLLAEDAMIDKYWLSYWIDVSPDGNLVIGAGEDVDVNVFDRRENKVVKSFEKLLPECGQCVKWNQDGKLFAVASEDCTAKVVDFASGKVIFEKKTADEKFAHSVAFI
eukprot:CAMPEP_0176411192 /NCGR_PEP_ID=MMETSP0127-20121128/3473_1 /TAXON_ID=938130 /ORGANISM="Platyophrya macrostoma, Strain WH" /LENGTH=332 /DNA_ID=CAMNT_0017790767 /DNA_START=47 /DNA_END=1045 /DNA_ORIENTATION=+